MKDITSLYSPETTLLRKFGSDHKGEKTSKIIYHGMVVYVDRMGMRNRPRYSCKIKVVGTSDPTDKQWKDYRFYPPLLPPHICSVPEVGEEVLLICEEPGDLSTAYWVNRISNSNKLTKTEIGDTIKTDDNFQTREGKYGSIELPKETADQDQPDPRYQDNNPRTKVGDVVLQGRSNTFVRHSFDVINRRGTIEIITEEDAKTTSEQNSLNYRKSLGGRVLSATMSDIDSLVLRDLYNLQFDDDFSKYGQQKNIDSAYLLLEALQLRLISRQGKKIQHAVLAEEQERWLVQLLDFLQQLVDDVNSFREIFEQHKHMANGQTSPPLPPWLTSSQVDLSNKLNEDKSNFETHKTPIPNHHSEKVALN